MRRQDVAKIDSPILLPRAERACGKLLPLPALQVKVQDATVRQKPSERDLLKEAVRRHDSHWNKTSHGLIMHIFLLTGDPFCGDLL